MLRLESNTYAVRDTDDLERLAQDVPAARRRIRRIELETRALSAEEARAWEGLLNRQLASRGSGSGVIGYVTALLSYLAYLLTGWAMPPDRGDWAIGLSIVVGGAALGKLVGLLLANLRLRRSALLLAALLRAVDVSVSGARQVPDAEGLDRVA